MAAGQELHGEHISISSPLKKRQEPSPVLYCEDRIESKWERHDVCLRREPCGQNNASHLAGTMVTDKSCCKVTGKIYCKGLPCWKNSILFFTDLFSKAKENQKVCWWKWLRSMKLLSLVWSIYRYRKAGLISNLRTEFQINVCLNYVVSRETGFWVQFTIQIWYWTLNTVHMCFTLSLTKHYLNFA